MRNCFFIYCFFLFGILLIPNTSFACSASKTEKTCCTKSSSEKEKKDCCKKENTDKKTDNDCNGNCGHSSCTCSSVSFSFFFLQVSNIDLGIDFKNFIEEINYISTLYSTDYQFIWQPPKIG